MKEIVSTAADEISGGIMFPRCRGDEQIDRVLVSVIDECDDCLAIEIIEPSSGQRKTVAEIAHLRCEIDLAFKPRFDGVLVR